MYRFFTLLVLLAFDGHSETLVLLSKCESATCVVMDLNTTGPKAFEKKRLVKDGSEELTFSVRGKPGKGHDRALRVLFHRKVGTDECRGLGPVAVVGMNEDRPIVATNAGPVELTDGSLMAGCSHCLRVVDPDTGKTLSEPPSPSRDLNHLGYGPKDFSVDKKGTAWLKSDETHCLKLTRDGDFITGDSDQCASKDPKAIPFPAVSPEPGFQRYEAGRFHLWIAEPNC